MTKYFTTQLTCVACTKVQRVQLHEHTEQCRGGDNTEGPVLSLLALLALLVQKTSSAASWAQQRRWDDHTDVQGSALTLLDVLVQKYNTDTWGAVRQAPHTPSLSLLALLVQQYKRITSTNVQALSRFDLLYVEATSVWVLKLPVYEALSFRQLRLTKRSLLLLSDVCRILSTSYTASKACQQLVKHVSWCMSNSNHI